ncbi:hypothetical protein Esti_005192 [Eimeria stiedai]
MGPLGLMGPQEGPPRPHTCSFLQLKPASIFKTKLLAASNLFRWPPNPSLTSPGEGVPQGRPSPCSSSSNNSSPEGTAATTAADAAAVRLGVTSALERMASHAHTRGALQVAGPFLKEQQQQQQQQQRKRPQQQQQQKKKGSRPESLSVPPEMLSAALERQHVEFVYDKIAPHFNHTRYRPWPRVTAFIESLEENALLVDVGCGNGKYLHCRPRSSSSSSDGNNSRSNSSSDSTSNKNNCSSSGSSSSCLSLGLDKSSELLRCAAARHPSADVGPRLLQADCLAIPLRDGVADGVICIAVLHHLATEGRRLQALRELGRITRPRGRILVYVWAFEHEAGSVGARSFPSQDVLVPWVYQAHHEENRASCLEEKDGGQGAPTRGPQGAPGGPLSGLSDGTQKTQETVYRYYRVFGKEELLEMCRKAEDLRVVEVFYDSNNWCVVLEKERPSEAS